MALETHTYIYDNDLNKTHKLLITSNYLYYNDSCLKNYQLMILPSDVYCSECGAEIETDDYYVYYIPDYPEQGEEIIFHFQTCEENHIFPKNCSHSLCTNRTYSPCMNCTFSIFTINEKNERIYSHKNKE